MAITQVSNSLVKQDLTISGGTVDNTVIGSGTPAAGTFTTIAGTLASTVTGTTAAASDNSTKIATTAYVTTALANLVDSAPGTLNTLNELAAALGDDASFSTTVTNSIAGKVALSGSGQTIADSGNFTLDVASTTIIDSGSSGQLILKHSGTEYGTLFHDSNHFYIQSQISDGDMIFRGKDGGSTITALMLDMSAAGNVQARRARSNTAGEVALSVQPSDSTIHYGFRIDSNTNSFNLDRVDSAGQLLTVNSSGNLAIGGSYTTPKEKLHVVGAAVFDGNHATATNAFRADEGVLIHGAGNVGYITAVSNGNNDVDLQFRALNGGSANSNQLVLGSNGYVGIGTSTLNKVFNMVDPAQGGEQIKLHFEASSGADLWNIYSYDRTNGHYTNMLLGQYTYLKSGGEVSIGNINGDFRVNQKLGVVGAGTRGGISVSSYINNTTSAIFDFNKSRHATPGNHTIVQDDDALGVFIWRGDDGTQFVDSAAISGNVDATPGVNDMPGRLEFYTSPDGTTGLQERMRIDSTGRVIIAHTSASFGTVGHEFDALGQASSTADGRTAVYLNRLSSDGKIQQFHKAGTEYGAIGNNVNNITVNGVNAVELRTGSGAGTTRAYVYSSGFHPWSDATYDLGVTSARWRQLYLSSGMFLGGVGTANKMEDFEEGTWTPSFYAGGLTVTQVNFAKYTKINNFVQIICYVSIGGTPNGANLTLAGLPFTVATNGFGVGTSDMEYQPVGTYIRAQSSTTQAIFLKPEGSSTGRSVLGGTNFNGGYGIFNFSYYTS